MGKENVTTEGRRIGDREVVAWGIEVWDWG